MRNFKGYYQSGQIAVVVLLIMVVLLTIGLSLATRTTQKIFLSQKETESARVFNVAESGIEDALSKDFSSIDDEQDFSNIDVANINMTTTITPSQILETRITEGASAHLSLQGLSEGDSVTILWSKTTGCNSAGSLIASVYYEDSLAGHQAVVHYAFGPDEDCGNGFALGSSGSDGYEYQYSINLPEHPLFMRLKAVYHDVPMMVNMPTNATNQLFVIRSQANNTLGDETKTIEVNRGLSTVPFFMDYAVYSGGLLMQQ